MYYDLGLWKKKSIILINKKNMFVIVRIEWCKITPCDCLEDLCHGVEWLKKMQMNASVGPWWEVQNFPCLVGGRIYTKMVLLLLYGRHRNSSFLFGFWQMSVQCSSQNNLKKHVCMIFLHVCLSWCLSGRKSYKFCSQNHYSFNINIPTSYGRFWM